MSSVITEPLGPRGRRRTRIGTIAAVVVGIGLLIFAVFRFAADGQLEADLWTPFIDFESGWPQFLFVEALWGTLSAAIVAAIGSVAAGFALALARIARNAVTRTVMRLYIDFVRTIPLILLIFLVFLGVPQALGLNLSRFNSLVIALVLYNSAVLAEIFRAGILSLPKGQSEAASAIGLTYWQSMRLVILPQAVRRMIPAIVAQIATITKDTSLGFLIGYQELLRTAQTLGQNFRNNLQAYFVASIVYFIIISLISRAARRLERQQRKKYGAGRIEVEGGPEDLDAMGEEADEEEAAEREKETATSA